jgi:hypothetical protein
VAITSLLIATKLEEYYSADINDLVIVIIIFIIDLLSNFKDSRLWSTIILKCGPGFKGLHWEQSPFYKINVNLKNYYNS